MNNKFLEKAILALTLISSPAIANYNQCVDKITNIHGSYRFYWTHTILQDWYISCNYQDPYTMVTFEKQVKNNSTVYEIPDDGRSLWKPFYSQRFICKKGSTGSPSECQWHERTLIN